MNQASISLITGIISVPLAFFLVYKFLNKTIKYVCDDKYFFIKFLEMSVVKTDYKSIVTIERVAGLTAFSRWRQQNWANLLFGPFVRITIDKGLFNKIIISPQEPEIFIEEIKKRTNTER